MKKIGILFVLCVVMIGCSNTKEAVYQTISPTKVNEIKKDLNIAIVDVRTIAEYASGHIENAMNIPLEKIGTIEDFISDKNKKIIVYCRSGSRSRKAAEQLLKLGYTNVYDMKGLDAWEYELKK